MILNLEQAVQCVRSGAVIAYPTEAVYGLGCDPLNELAVMKLLGLKSRSVHKGLILISDSFESLKPYLNIALLSNSQLQAALDTWPGPFTWVFPASSLVPTWIKGEFNSIAVRVTGHGIASELCRTLGMPLVSTSANINGALPARSTIQVLEQFPEGLEGILIGELDLNRGPSEIRDIQTGAALRS